MSVVKAGAWTDLTTANSLANGTSYLVQNRAKGVIVLLEEDSTAPTATDEAIALTPLGQEGNTTRFTQVDGMKLWGTCESGGAANVVVKAAS